MKKKHGWVKVIAIFAAVAGAAIAIMAFLRKKGKKIKEELDFDDEMYFDDDDDMFEDDIMNGDDTVGPTESDDDDRDDETMPEESADGITADANDETEKKLTEAEKEKE